MAQIRIIEQSSNAPMIGANLMFLDSSKNAILVPDVMTGIPFPTGMSVDVNGYADVPATVNGTAIKYVSVSYVGYEGVTTTNTTQTVALHMKENVLDQVTVTACGKYNIKNATTGVCEFSWAEYIRKNQLAVALVVMIIGVILFLLFHQD